MVTSSGASLVEIFTMGVLPTASEMLSRGTPYPLPRSLAESFVPPIRKIRLKKSRLASRRVDGGTAWEVAGGAKAEAEVARRVKTAAL